MESSAFNVVCRIDVNHLNPTDIRLLEDLKNFEIFSLDKDVLGVIDTISVRCTVCYESFSINGHQCYFDGTAASLLASFSPSQTNPKRSSSESSTKSPKHSRKVSKLIFPSSKASGTICLRA